MSGWTKLFSSLPTSSIWSEDYATRIVWTTMLAVSDMDGLVEGSVPGFARLANVTVDEMTMAIETLSATDRFSRTPDHEGRRIEAIEGGWRILNYPLYRERGQGKDGSKAPAMRAYRARKRAEGSDVAPKQVMPGNALPASVTSDPEARGESTSTPQPPRGGLSVGDRQFAKPEHIITSPDLEGRAGAFLRRFVALHATVRHGALLRLKPARDFPNAITLVDTWRDDAHLEKMAELFFRRDEWADKNTPGQFLAVAPRCDALLRQHGHVPAVARCAP
jgi:hypothetical protein